MADYIAPLNLQYIFQNVLSGSPEVFFALFMILLSVLAGRFRMNGGVFLLMFGLASIILYSWIDGALFTITIFVGGLIIFFAIKKVVS